MGTANKERLKIEAKVGTDTWVWELISQRCAVGILRRRRNLDNTLPDAWIIQGTMTVYEFLDQMGTMNKRGQLKKIKFQ